MLPKSPLLLLTVISTIFIGFIGKPIFCFGAEAEQTGTIGGVLLDPDGQVARVGNAVVFLCEAETGMPLSSKTNQVVELGTEAMFDFSSFLHAVTSEKGGFEFKSVQPGTYRLVAQSWAGISGMPRGLPRSSRSDPGVEPSSTIILHGVVENIKVTAGNASPVYPKQLGYGVARIVTDPKEAGNFLLISKNRRLGDVALGPVGWGREFITGVVGVTRMEDHHVTLVGLPDKVEFHTGLFNYDNNAGMGGHSFVVGQEQLEPLPIYAGWSNGKYEPTARLAKLTAHLEQADIDVEKLIPLRGLSFTKEYFDFVWSRANQQFDVPGYGKAKLIDLLAADQYKQSRRLRLQSEQRRAERRAAHTKEKVEDSD